MLSLLMMVLCPAPALVDFCPARGTNLGNVGTATQLSAMAAPPPPTFRLNVKPSALGGNEIHRAADGLFYVDAYVNGAPIRFMVDTGASVVVLKLDDARRAGINPTATDFTAGAETANGQAQMARVTLDQVVVGDNRSQSVDAAVVRDNLPVSLLGQTWLTKLASVTISGDRMIFSPL